AALSAALLAVVAVAFGVVLGALHGANEQRQRADEQRREAEARQEQLRAVNADLTREKAEHQAAEGRATRAAVVSFAARDEAQRSGYFNGIGLAAELAPAGDLAPARGGPAGARAGGVVAGCPARHRLGEWNSLDRLCRGERLALPDQAGAVAALAFSPDGKYVAVANGGRLAEAAGREAGVTLYEAEGGRQ